MKRRKGRKSTYEKTSRGTGRENTRSRSSPVEATPATKRAEGNMGSAYKGGGDASGTAGRKRGERLTYCPFTAVGGERS